MAIYRQKIKNFLETRKKLKLSIKGGLRSSEGNYTTQDKPPLKSNLDALKGYASGSHL